MDHYVLWPALVIILLITLFCWLHWRLHKRYVAMKARKDPEIPKDRCVQQVGLS